MRGYYNKTDFTVPSKHILRVGVFRGYYNKTDFTVPSKHNNQSDQNLLYYNKTDFTVPSKLPPTRTEVVSNYNKTDFTVPSKPAYTIQIPRPSRECLYNNPRPNTGGDMLVFVVIYRLSDGHTPL